MKLGLIATTLALAAFALGVYAFQSQPNSQTGKPKTYAGLTIEEVSPKRKDKVVKSDAEWKKQLTTEQYRILRNKGTEAAFCSGQLEKKGDGTYHCVGCDLALFKADSKFDSGTGWPSFFQPFNRENVWLKTDLSFGMVRVEVLCSRCDGHLGHVFDDGPKDKTGIRYCINGEILKFKPAL